MAEWTVSSVCSEMKDCSALLQARKTSPDNNLQSKMLQVLEFKLKALQHVSAADALVLHKALSECEFSKDMAEKLASSIDALMGQQQQPTCVQSLKPQTLQNIQLFLTASEWKLLDDCNVAWWTKQKALVDRLKKLGFRSMSEQTVRACVALLCCTLSTLPQDDDALLQISKEFKECFGTSDKPESHVPYVVMFPDQPSGLPEQLLGHAYSKEDPPVPRDVPKLAHMKSLMVLRNSKKTLKKNRIDSRQSMSANVALPEAIVPSSSSQGSMPWGNMMAMMGVMAQVMQQCAKGQGSDSSASSFNSFAEAAQHFEPKAAARDKKPIPLQLEDLQVKPAQQGSLPLSDQAGPASTAPAENSPAKIEGDEHKQYGWQSAAANDKANLEEQLFQTLKDKKKAVAANAKAGKSKGASKGGGRVLKRPSAANPSLKPYQAPAPTDVEMKSQKVCFVDKHYHKARKIAKDANLSDEECCIYGRAARALAGKKWDSAQ